MTTARPLRRDAVRNRAALIEAARTVFAERGLDASLDDVAHQAGVGVGTAYRHFANKYELAEAIMREAVEEIVALAHESGEIDDPWDGLVHFLEGSCVAQIANRGLHEVLMGMHDESLANEASQRLIAPLTESRRTRSCVRCAAARDRCVRRRHHDPLPHDDRRRHRRGVRRRVAQIPADLPRRIAHRFAASRPRRQRRGDAHGVRVIQGTDCAHPPLTASRWTGYATHPDPARLPAARSLSRDARAGRRGLRPAQPARPGTGRPAGNAGCSTRLPWRVRALDARTGAC